MSHEIQPEEYKNMRAQAEPHTLLDVRQLWEVEKSSISGSLHIPLTDLISQIDNLDKSKKIIVYCHHGIRSLNACLFLRELGFQDVLSLSGGIDQWAATIDKTIPRY